MQAYNKHAFKKLIICILSACVVFLKASFDYSGGTKSRRDGWLVFGCRRGLSGCWRIQLSPASPELPGVLRAVQPGCGVASARRWEQAGLLSMGDWDMLVQGWAFPGTFIQDHRSFRLTGWMRIGICWMKLIMTTLSSIFFVLYVHWNLHQLKVLYVHVSEAASILHFILCQLLMFEEKLWIHHAYIWISSFKYTSLGWFY